MDSIRSQVLRALSAWPSSCFLQIVVLLVIALSADGLLPWPGLAQDLGPGDKSPIRVRVNLVSTPVVVQNVADELVTDLTENNFRIFDNGVQQTLQGVELGGAPVSVVLVVETSSRVAALTPLIRGTGLLFAQHVVGETGDAAVIGFDDRVVKVVDFTGDHDILNETIANLQPGTSGANLNDALALAVDSLRNLPVSRRRVIIAVAEAIDTGSNEKLSAVVREAQVENITMYSIGLSTTIAEVRGPQQQVVTFSPTPPGTYALGPLPGTANAPTINQFRDGSIDIGALVKHAWSFVAREPSLEAAISATGGLYQSTFRYDSMERAIDRIAGELHSQYTLVYLPNTKPAKNGFHQIKVVVVGQPDIFEVRFRPGYYASLPQK